MSEIELQEKIAEQNREIQDLKDRIVEIKGWKGESGIEIKEDGTNIICIEHRKNKEDGEVEKNVHTIPQKNVQELWKIIKKLTPDGVKVKYRILIPTLITHYEFDVDVDSFNGGKNRAKYYFPYYYYPCKILEHWDFIDYTGRGTIIRKDKQKTLF